MYWVNILFCHLWAIHQWKYPSAYRDKMADFLHTWFPCIFLTETFKFQIIWIIFSLRYSPCGITGNKPSLVQITDCHQKAEKSLSAPMMAYFTDAYVSLDLDELMPLEQPACTIKSMSYENSKEWTTSNAVLQTVNRYIQHYTHVHCKSK